MIIAAFVVSLVALAVSILSIGYTRRQVLASEQAELRARRPVLDVSLDAAVSGDSDSALYYVENRGGEDLDSVVVFRPLTDNNVRYPVAPLGGEYDDKADLGPLEMKAKKGWVLAIGGGEHLPEFRVRIRCTRGKDVWEDACILEDPRFHLSVF